ncbi:hypothetical protein VNI00_018687 [Paramarasmius palmivorus]|uniref:Uncharacterized protein n=1 Tax=Paramarasmius palmivorus TaxID=297713 RepID=A0AAW0AV49_9AGAR
MGDTLCVLSLTGVDGVEVILVESNVAPFVLPGGELDLAAAVAGWLSMNPALDLPLRSRLKALLLQDMVVCLRSSSPGSLSQISEGLTREVKGLLWFEDARIKLNTGALHIEELDMARKGSWNEVYRTLSASHIYAVFLVAKKHWMRYSFSTLPVYHETDYNPEAAFCAGSATRTSPATKLGCFLSFHRGILPDFVRMRGLGRVRKVPNRGRHVKWKEDEEGEGKEIDDWMKQRNIKFAVRNSYGTNRKLYGQLYRRATEVMFAMRDYMRKSGTIPVGRDKQVFDTLAVWERDPSEIIAEILKPNPDPQVMLAVMASEGSLDELKRDLIEMQRTYGKATRNGR